jgi:hypothetical protein
MLTQTRAAIQESIQSKSPQRAESVLSATCRCLLRIPSAYYHTIMELIACTCRIGAYPRPRSGGAPAIPRSPTSTPLIASLSGLHFMPTTPCRAHYHFHISLIDTVKQQRFSVGLIVPSVYIHHVGTWGQARPARDTLYRSLYSAALHKHNHITGSITWCNRFNDCTDKRLRPIPIQNSQLDARALTYTLQLSSHLLACFFSNAITRAQNDPTDVVSCVNASD